MDKLNKMLPLQQVNIPQAFSQGKEEEKRFILKLTLFLKHFYKNWLPTLENAPRECSGTCKNQKYISKIFFKYLTVLQKISKIYQK